MKLQITLAFVVSMLGLGGTVSAAPATDEVKPAQSYLSTVIDNVPVPYEVLTYAQMKYQGHAVTEVKQISLSNRQVYQLRVDGDDILKDYTGIHLIYDTGWNLLDKKELTPPPPVIVPEPEVEKDEPKPQKPDKEEEKEDKEKEKKEDKEDIEENRRNSGNSSEEEENTAEEEENTDEEESAVVEEEPTNTSQNADATNTDTSDEEGQTT